MASSLVKILLGDVYLRSGQECYILMKAQIYKSVIETHRYYKMLALLMWMSL